MTSAVRSALLISLTICLFIAIVPAQTRRRAPRAAAPQTHSDWAYPKKEIKSELFAGRRMYFLGDGFVAESPRRSTNGGQHANVIISERTAAEFVASVEQGRASADEIQKVLAWAVYGKVCKGHAEGLNISDAYIGPAVIEIGGHTGTEHHFRTVSGNTARIYVSTDRRSAIVMIDPAEAEDAASDDQPAPEKRRTYLTFGDLRLIYIGKSKDAVLRGLGKPVRTYDAGGRVSWTYHALAYDPVLGQRKNVSIWFNQNGFADSISER